MGGEKEGIIEIKELFGPVAVRRRGRLTPVRSQAGLPNFDLRSKHAPLGGELGKGQKTK